MPMKTCPKCQQKSGPRTAKCAGCGHQFIGLAEGVGKAAGIDPLPLPALDTLAPVQQIVAPVQVVKKLQIRSFPTSTNKGTGRIIPFDHGGRIVTPAGSPPCKPQGYPWKEGEVASDDVIREWAEQIRAVGLEKGDRYAAEAICYWAGRFWQGKEHSRVKEIIYQAFVVG